MHAGTYVCISMIMIKVVCLIISTFFVLKTINNVYGEKVCPLGVLVFGVGVTRFKRYSEILFSLNPPDFFRKSRNVGNGRVPMTSAG